MVILTNANCKEDARKLDYGRLNKTW